MASTNPEEFKVTPLVSPIASPSPQGEHTSPSPSDTFMTQEGNEELRIVLQEVCDDDQGSIFRKLVSQDLLGAMDLAFLEDSQLKELQLTTGLANRLWPFSGIARYTRNFLTLV